MSNLDIALALAANGYRVFPLAPDSKRPIIKNFPDKATTDTATVRKWWSRPDRDVAIATGKGLVVVDPDAKDGKPGLANWQTLADLHGLPAPAFDLTTQSGGRHIYYRADKGYGNGSGRIAPGIDHRCEGGFVKFYGDRIPPPLDRLQPLPEPIAKRLALKREGDGKPIEGVELDTPDAIKRAATWLEQHAPEAIEGAGGESTTYQVAARVKDFGVSEPVALDLLLGHWNVTKAMPPWMPDELAIKVANAYRYGTSGAGAMSPEADFGLPPPNAAEKTDPLPQKKRRLQLEWFKDIQPDAGKRPLVKNLINHQTMTVLYGQSNEGKTFVALDLSLHIALGWDWQGHRTDQGAVIYIAAEGGGGIRKRLAAFRQFHGIDGQNVPFAVIPAAVDLLDPQADLNDLVALVREAAARAGLPAVLVVIDTLARAIGGGNENAPDDMGAFVRNVDALRARTGAGVLVVHHSGKDQARGARGHSSLRAATDTEFEVANRTVRHAKQRDLEEGNPILFGLKPVQVGTDPDGEAIVSCVVTGRQADPNADFHARVDKLPDRAKDALQVLRRCVEAAGEAPPAGLEVPAGVTGVTVDVWRAAFEAEYVAADGANMDSVRRIFRRAWPQLTQAGVVDTERGFAWVCS